MAKTAKKAAPKKAVKKVATKAAAKPAAPKPIKEVLTKSGLVAHIAEASGVVAKDVRAVLASLEAPSPPRCTRRALAPSPCRAC